MRKFLLGVACLCVVIVLFELRSRGRSDAADDRDASPASQSSRDIRDVTRQRKPRDAVTDATDPSHAIDQTREVLRRAGSRDAAHEALASAKARLLDAGPGAAAAVAAELRAGTDVPTRLAFAVGADGVLSEAPTWRAALLDWLPALDPELALELAREVLRETQSPDEYALALRNIAWNDLNGDLRAELSAAFLAMLERREWRDQPSAGFLEAMDVAVQLGGPDTFARISMLAAPDANDETLVRAAAMAMDRMILRDPSLLVTAWRNNPAWMDNAPLQRASMMSRLDITREDHRKVFEEYLSSPRMTEEEADYFVRIHPNGNRLHGHRLVSSAEAAPSIEQQAETDRRTITTLDSMIPGLPARAATTATRIRERLGRFVGK